MATKEAVIDRLAQTTPAAGYLGVYLGGMTVQDIVAVLTGLLVLGQIIKLGLEFKDRWAAKRKEQRNDPEKPTA